MFNYKFNHQIHLRVGHVVCLFLILLWFISGQKVRADRWKCATVHAVAKSWTRLKRLSTHMRPDFCLLSFVSKLSIVRIICMLQVFWGFPCGSMGKESACSAGDTGDMGSIPGSGRLPGEGNGNPLNCLKKPHGQRSLVAYSPKGRRVGHN